MSVSPQTIAKRRVAKGAKLLDREMPGWLRKIRTTRLDLACGSLSTAGCGCVLVQLSPNGSASEGLDRLDLTMAGGILNGFYTTQLDSYGVTYGHLQEAWLEEIRVRRAAVRAERK